MNDQRSPERRGMRILISTVQRESDGGELVFSPRHQTRQRRRPCTTAAPLPAQPIPDYEPKIPHPNQLPEAEVNAKLSEGYSQKICSRRCPVHGVERSRRKLGDDGWGIDPAVIQWPTVCNDTTHLIATSRRSALACQRDPTDCAIFFLPRQRPHQAAQTPLDSVWMEEQGGRLSGFIPAFSPTECAGINGCVPQARRNPLRHPHFAAGTSVDRW
jgi:hypothetical protein